MNESRMETIGGSCQCGAVRFEITDTIRGLMHCHCRTCRKIHGTVYGSSALVVRTGFRVISGEQALTEYESSPGKKRCFCSHCGSHVFAYFDAQPETVVLRIGTLDSDPGIRAQAHIWVSDRAPWYEIHDTLPQFEGPPDRR